MPIPPVPFSRSKKVDPDQECKSDHKQRFRRLVNGELGKIGMEMCMKMVPPCMHEVFRTMKVAVRQSSLQSIMFFKDCTDSANSMQRFLANMQSRLPEDMHDFKFQYSHTNQFKIMISFFDLAEFVYWMRNYDWYDHLICSNRLNTQIVPMWASKFMNHFYVPSESEETFPFCLLVFHFLQSVSKHVKASKHKSKTDFITSVLKIDEEYLCNLSNLCFCIDRDQNFRRYYPHLVGLKFEILHPDCVIENVTKWTSPVPHIVQWMNTEVLDLEMTINGRIASNEIVMVFNIYNFMNRRKFLKDLQMEVSGIYSVG